MMRSFLFRLRMKKETVMITKDEGPRPGTTKESLAKLKCCSGKEGGLVTAGNASGINDGAAAIVVMSEEKAKELGVKPMATFVAGALGGCRSGDHGYRTCSGYKEGHCKDRWSED